jgi:hypothetical protein
MDGSSEMASLPVAALIHHIGGVRRGAGENGNVGSASFAEKSIDDFGSGLGVAEGGGYAENFKLGAAESQRECEGVVDVIADVGVDDDFLWRAWDSPRLLRLGAGNRANEQ